MKKLLTRNLTFGALAVAFFTAVYAVFAVNESMTQEVLSFLACLPLAVYVYMFGIKSGLIALFAALGLSAFLVQLSIYFTYAVPNAIICTVMGILVLKSTLYTAAIVTAVLNFANLFVEMFFTRLFFEIDPWLEYKEIINKVTAFFTNGSVASQLAHDMTLCSIPTLFLVASCAKAIILTGALVVILNRLFKKGIRIQIPRFTGREKLFAIIYLTTEVLSVALSVLVLTGVLGYSFAVAVILDIELVVMYVYLLYQLQRFDDRKKFHSPAGIALALVIMVLFPISDTVLALRDFRF